MNYKEFLIKAKKVLETIEQSKKKSYVQYYILDKDLGWKLNKNSKHNSLPYSSDSQGNRKINNKKSQKGKKKIVIIGDSMVHGDEVSDRQTWCYFLSQKIKKKFNVINLGVSGYGNDQAFLRFKKYIKKEKVKIAIFCFNSGNELRNVNVQRLFLNNKGGFIYLKPRYELKNNKIFLIRPPKQKTNNYYSFLKSNETQTHLKNYDYFYPNIFKKILRSLFEKISFNSSYNYYLIFNKKKILQLTYEIFKLFFSLCRKEKIIPIILFLPKLEGSFKNDDNLIYLKNKIENIKIKNLYPKKILLNNNGEVIKKYFCKKNHYSAYGGKVLAETIYNYIKKNNYY